MDMQLAGPGVLDSRKIGRIVSISGSQVVMVLEDEEGRHNVDIETPIPSIGTLVKMFNSGSAIFGLVSGLSIPIPSESAEDPEMKIVELELLGQAAIEPDGARGPFTRGVSTFPMLSGPVYTSTLEDLQQVYGRRNVATAPIGVLHQDQQTPAYISVDDLLGKHFAVLGTTGSGKSCAVALILRSVLQEHKHGHALLLDLHAEYAHAFQDMAEVISPETMELPYWLLNFQEIREILIDRTSAQPETQANILAEVITEAKRAFPNNNEAADIITVDTPVPYRLSEVERLLDQNSGMLNRPTDAEPYLRLKSRLTALTNDRRYSFMFSGIAVRDNMVSILSRLFRIPTDGMPITIVDLSTVPSEILNVVVSLLCRMTFDFVRHSERKVPVLLVCEETHRYAPQSERMGFESAKSALSRMAKEGRKYGASLCIISQRPSELATGMLSQCNTVFALRMSNQRDQEFVRGTLSESGAGLLDSLPSLRNAECIAVGEGVAVPVRLCFSTLAPEHRPKGGTAKFSDAWSQETADRDLVTAIVDQWRRRRQ